MCARSLEKGSAAITSIKSIYPQAHITLLEIDHLSLSSVVSAAATFLSKETILHGLVNNAGIMATPFEMTKDGYEAQWQTNYLAHWVFTSKLLPLMLSTSKTLPSGSVRIVNLSSFGHYNAPKGGINFADTTLPNDAVMVRYGQSKLAILLHAKILNKAYGPGSPSVTAGNGEIWTAIVHPGLVESQLGVGAEMSAPLRAFFAVIGVMGARVGGDKGSWTSVFCIASPEMTKEQSGTYFQRIAEAGWQSRLAKDMTLAEKLEEWTAEEMKKERWV